MTTRLAPSVRNSFFGAQSEREAELLNRILRAGLPRPITQHRIVPTRRFRWDFAWPEYGVCLELQGGVWRSGAHNRGQGVTRDAEKSSLAQLNGWLQITVTPDQVQSGVAVGQVIAALVLRGWDDDNAVSN